MRIAFQRERARPESIGGLEEWLRAGAPADLVVLPECWLDDPTASDGADIEIVRQACLAASQALLFGYCEACSGEIFSALQLIDGRGIAMANYRCSHPSDDRFGIGRWLTIVPWHDHRLALLAGPDLFVPEAWRAAALGGATAIVWVGAEWSANAAVLLQARAIECGLPVAGSDGDESAAFDSQGVALRAVSPGEFVLGLPHPARFPARRQPVLYRVLTEEHALR